jgi:hypothetical protein
MIGWSARRGAGVLIGVGVPLALGAELLIGSWHQLLNYLPDDTIVLQHRPAFEAVRERMTVQDRMYQVPGERSAGFEGLFDGTFKKTGQLFRVPSIVDYEPQTSSRYAELLVRMLYGEPMKSLNQFMFLNLKLVPTSRPLFDLLATRFVVIDAERAEGLGWPSGPALALAWEHDGQRVYENREAMPRAFYVPRAKVLGDGAAVLEALASGREDPRRTALLEGPTQAVLGTPDGTGSAEIVDDLSEVLTVRVRASAPGYLFVADQYEPGWRATVDGRPAPIARANFAFRLVDVPAGASRVEFRYRQRGLSLGAAVSAGALAMLVGLAWRARTHA